MLLKQARRVSLSEVVLSQLLASMRGGKLKPGDRLPSEAGLCAMLRVGRSSVREAMRVLAFMGLVESNPGRGTVVAKGVDNPIPRIQEAFTLQSAAMLDLYEVRSILESGAAALAAQRATPTDLAAIERSAKAVEERVALRQSYFDENVRFHLAIARASHNNILVESLRRLLGQIRGFRQRMTDTIQDLPARDVAEHRAILAAIREGSGRRAQSLMSQHIASTIGAAHLRRTDPGGSDHRTSSGRWRPTHGA